MAVIFDGPNAEVPSPAEIAYRSNSIASGKDVYSEEKEKVNTHAEAVAV